LTEERSLIQVPEQSLILLLLDIHLQARCSHTRSVRLIVSKYLHRWVKRIELCIHLQDLEDCQLVSEFESCLKVSSFTLSDIQKDILIRRNSKIDDKFWETLNLRVDLLDRKSNQCFYLLRVSISRQSLSDPSHLDLRDLLHLCLKVNLSWLMLGFKNAKFELNFDLTIKYTKK